MKTCISAVIYVLHTVEKEVLDVVTKENAFVGGVRVCLNF